jgi:hypothetical protein
MFPPYAFSAGCIGTSQSSLAGISGTSPVLACGNGVTDYTLMTTRRPAERSLGAAMLREVHRIIPDAEDPG